MASQQPTGGHRLLAMTVNNIGFLLDRLGQDCHPLQFIRELTKNSGGSRKNGLALVRN